MGSKSIILAIGLIIFTIALAVLFVISRVSSGSNSDDKIVNSQDSQRNVVSVLDIINNPTVYNGYNLEVDSGISDWTTNRSFTFSVGGSGAFNNTRRQLLVIAQNPFQLPQDTNDDRLGLGEITKVTVKGQIQILDREQLEAELGVDLDSPEFALDNNNIDKWNLGPVLVAKTIVVNTSAK